MAKNRTAPGNEGKKKTDVLEYWIALGAGVGCAFGVIFGQIGLGIAFGVCVGIVIGSAAASRGGGWTRG